MHPSRIRKLSPAEIPRKPWWITIESQVKTAWANVPEPLYGGNNNVEALFTAAHEIGSSEVYFLVSSKVSDCYHHQIYVI